MARVEEEWSSEEEKVPLAMSGDEGADDDEDDDLLAQFLESEVLAQDSESLPPADFEDSESLPPADFEDSDQEEFILRPSKRLCLEEEVKDRSNIAFTNKGFAPVDDENQLGTGSGVVTNLRPALQSSREFAGSHGGLTAPPCIENGVFSKIPAELFQKILKFLSSEDLVTCALVCRFLNFSASDESLWRRLYCMRWGLTSPAERQGKLRACAWKQLYIERDEEDMVEFARNTPTEFREYYIQMQAAKRSQAPLPSQVNDDLIILDTTVADQITCWKHSRGLPDELTEYHVCSGRTCTYSKIGDAFLCEKTGQVHVCDDTCRETVLDPTSQLLVCTISGRCFDRWLSPSEEESDPGQQQGDGNATMDEAEPFMGSGRFARAYLLGYNCDDEKELEAALAWC